MDMTAIEIVEWTCERFESAECIQDLQIFAEMLSEDKIDKHEYTLLPGALDCMRGVYSRRLAELREVAK